MGVAGGGEEAFEGFGGRFVAEAEGAVVHREDAVGAAMQGALARPLLADITSVMDFGIMLGALLAAGLAGRFAPVRRVPWRHLAGSAVGGLLLGYGARLGFLLALAGCLDFAITSPTAPDITITNDNDNQVNPTPTPSPTPTGEFGG